MRLYETNNYYLVSGVVDDSVKRMGIGKLMHDFAINNLSNYHKNYRALAICVSEGGRRLCLNSGFVELLEVHDRYVLEYVYNE